MKRITVTLPDELAERVDRERRRRDVSAATVIRDAVEAHVSPQTSNGTTRRVLRIAALGRGGGNVAEHMEEILAADARSREGLDAMMYGTSPESVHRSTNGDADTQTPPIEPRDPASL